MITLEQYKLLCEAEVRQAIAENISRNPFDVALDRSEEHTSELQSLC